MAKPIQRLAEPQGWKYERRNPPDFWGIRRANGQWAASDGMVLAFESPFVAEAQLELMRVWTPDMVRGATVKMFGVTMAASDGSKAAGDGD